MSQSKSPAAAAARDQPTPFDRARYLLAAHQPRVLNVAGNRNPAGTSVMFDATVELLAVIFTELDALDLVRRDTDL